jgi:hypothetical protein
MEVMCQGCVLSKTKSPIDTGCEKRWYLIDGDHALPPIARQKKRQVVIAMEIQNVKGKTICRVGRLALQGGFGEFAG